MVLHPGKAMGELRSVKSVVALRPPDAYPQPEVNSSTESKYSQVSALNVESEENVGPCDDGLWDPEIELDENVLCPA